MELNRTLANYSHHDDENAAYHAMQSTGFLIAGLLLDQPKGTMTAPIMGHRYWVSPVADNLELVCSPDVPWIFMDDDNFSALLASGFEGLGVEELNHIRASMVEWLHAPVFEHAKDPGAPDRVARRVFGRVW